jgi:multidrug resistance efflux pump
MVTEHPKWRDDLVVSERIQAGRTAYVVKDPYNERFFQFHEPEIFMARQMDGGTSLDTIRARGEEQFNATLAPGTVTKFAEKLRVLGLLEVNGEALEIAQPRRGRVRGSLLYLRFKAINPDALFARLTGSVGWFFSGYFGVVAAVLMAIALVISVTHGVEISQTLVRFYRTDTLILAWGVLLLVITLHEFAHGLACKRFGGRVSELGFMLIFFQPAMYCNVSDAWLFPEKSKRLWVTFAGAYFELFLWALATITWRVTDPNLLVNHLAFIVMVTSGIKTFFNLNPLIKLDGYYLLSDYLEVPNLNQRSFRYLSYRTKRLLGLTQEADEQSVAPREARILIIYGLLATVFSFALLGYIALLFGGYLIARYQAVGFCLATGLWFLMFRHTIKRALVGPATWLASEKGRTRRKRLAKVVVSLALLFSVLYFAPMELTVSAALTLAPSQNADIRPEVEGIIEDVLVQEGDRVRAGDPIVRLSETGYRAEIEKNLAHIAAAQATLHMLQAGPTREESNLAQSKIETVKARLKYATQRHAEAERVHAKRLTKAKTTVEKAEQQLVSAVRDLDRVKQLVESGVGSSKELEDAEAAQGIRAKELGEAQGDLDVLVAEDLSETRDAIGVAEQEIAESESERSLLMAGSRPEQIEVTEAEIARLQAQNRFLEKQLALLNITSPCAGVVTTVKLREKVGQLVEKGDLIACVHQLDKVIAEVPVPEKEIADVSLGQEVVVKLRAFPNQTFIGQVASIAAAAKSGEGWELQKTILVTLELDNTSGELKPEMTGHAKIQCGERRIIDIVTRRFVRYFRVEFWSWW